MSRKNPNHLLLLCSISHYAKQWQHMKLLFAKASGLKAIRCCSLASLYKLAQTVSKCQSISDRLFTTSIGISRNATILSNFREPYHVQTEGAIEDFFFSSCAPQKGKGRLPHIFINKKGLDTNGKIAVAVTCEKEAWKDTESAMVLAIFIQ